MHPKALTCSFGFVVIPLTQNKPFSGFVGHSEHRHFFTFSSESTSSFSGRFLSIKCIVIVGLLSFNIFQRRIKANCSVKLWTKISFLDNIEKCWLRLSIDSKLQNKLQLILDPHFLD
jgi:hypothetical protein